MKDAKSPEFIRFFRPIIEALIESGGTGTPAEIVDRSLEIAQVPAAELDTVNENGQSRVKNLVLWSCQYLVWEGYLDSSKRDLWSLTDKGMAVDLNNFNALAVYKSVQKNLAGTKNTRGRESHSPDAQIPDALEIQAHRARVLDLISSLTPGGFERLSQRLLHEYGLQHVLITGKSGDGGIDGIGTLQINPHVSFNALFQCKKQRETVTPSQVLDFREAMMGCADKGIIITTGTFSLEATKEAKREGVPPIELVDGDTLADMVAERNLGLTTKPTYGIDE